MTEDQHDELLAQIALLEAAAERLVPTGGIYIASMEYEGNERLYKTIGLQLMALQGFVAGLRLAGYRK